MSTKADLLQALTSYRDAVRESEETPLSKRDPNWVRRVGARVKAAWEDVLDKLVWDNPPDDPDFPHDPGGGGGGSTGGGGTGGGGTTTTIIQDLEYFKVIMSEDVPAGTFINVYSQDGVARGRKAIATSIDTKADGFVKEGYSSDSLARVFFSKVNQNLLGLVIGETYYLSELEEGGVTDTHPTGSAQIVQPLGKAVNTTTLLVDIEDPTILATEPDAI